MAFRPGSREAPISSASTSSIAHEAVDVVMRDSPDASKDPDRRSLGLVPTQHGRPDNTAQPTRSPHTDSRPTNSNAPIRPHLPPPPPHPSSSTTPPSTPRHPQQRPNLRRREHGPALPITRRPTIAEARILTDLEPALHLHVAQVGLALDVAHGPVHVEARDARVPPAVAVGVE